MWPDWLSVILLCVLLIAGIVYWLIRVMRDLFPKKDREHSKVKGDS